MVKNETSKKTKEKLSPPPSEQTCSAEMSKLIEIQTDGLEISNRPE